MTHCFLAPLRFASVRPLAVLAAVLALGVAGCEAERSAPTGQTAAKVNDEAIGVEQVRLLLQQQRSLRPEQVDAASRQALERLIDQRLAAQKAQERKLDQDARVVAQLDAARREVLARAYLEKVAEGATKPTAEEVKKYYDDKPALFRERRIYNIQEISIEARPDQVPLLRDKLAGVKNVGEFVEFLKANDYKFSGNQAVRAAEQLPLQNLDAFARLRDGQGTIVPTPAGVQVVVLAGSRSQPVSEEQARPAIEQFLLNERKRKLMEEDVKALRAAAKIEYVGNFAPGASAPAAVALPVSAPGSGAKQ